MPETKHKIISSLRHVVSGALFFTLLLRPAGFCFALGGEQRRGPLLCPRRGTAEGAAVYLVSIIPIIETIIIAAGIALIVTIGIAVGVTIGLAGFRAGIITADLTRGKTVSITI